MTQSAHDELVRSVTEIEDADGLTRNEHGRPSYMPAPLSSREDLGNGIIVEIDTITGVRDVAIRHLGRSYGAMRAAELRTLMREVVLRLIEQRDAARTVARNMQGASVRPPCPPSPPPPPPPCGRSPRYQAPNVPGKAPSARWIVTALLGFAAGVLATLVATGIA